MRERDRWATRTEGKKRVVLIDELDQIRSGKVVWAVARLERVRVRRPGVSNEEWKVQPETPRLHCRHPLLPPQLRIHPVDLPVPEFRIRHVSRRWSRTRRCYL
jgi:hypothetical protein